MEIAWGDFYFQMEGTGVILLAATPVVLLFYVPRVVDGLKTIVYLVRRGRRHKMSLQEQIDAKVR